MNTKAFTVLGLVVVAVSGCAAMEKPRVDPRVASQVVVSKNDPAPNCTYLKPIRGIAIVGDLGEANHDLVRNAVLEGGNFVAVDMVERNVGGYELQGRLYECPVPAPVQVAALGASERRIASDATDAIVLPKAICEPTCSPGFTCLHAICVSACNPGCGAGEQCGADRACHPAK